MPRTIFTADNLQSVRPVLDHPVAQKILSTAISLKQVSVAARHVAQMSYSLPIDVQSRETPEGVPLNAIMVALQKQLPSVTALSVRAGKIFVTASAPFSVQDIANMQTFFNNKEALQNLKTTDPLIAVLTNASTPDMDWLKAFRAYAVRSLIKG